MKKIDLGQSIMILANIGVIAGIAFFALEIRQGQRLASAENGMSFAASRNATLAEINLYSDIWIRGNSGTTLSDQERAIYLNLLDSYNDIYFFNYFQNISVGDEATSRVTLTELAYFLYQNPGAYRAWEELEQFSSRSREVLVPEFDTRIGDDFQEFIREGIAKFESLEE